MISSLRNFSVCILDADRFTIVVFQILDIKSNYLPGIVHTLGGRFLCSIVSLFLCNVSHVYSIYSFKI
jgi:hypothetical protein